MPDPAELMADGQRYQRAGVLDRALACFERAAELSADPTTLSEALRRQGAIHRARCAWPEAVAAVHRAAEVAREAGLNDLHAEALNAEANVCQARGELDRARVLLEQVLALEPDDRVRGMALQNLGTVAARTGEHGVAEQRYREAYERFHRAGYRQGEATALLNFGALVNDRGDHEAAESILKRAIGVASDLEDADLTAIATKNLAEALAGQERYPEAMYHASAALGFFATAGQQWRQVECFILLGDVSTRLGEAAAARGCWTQGLALAREIGAVPEIAALERRLADAGELAAPSTRQ